MRAIRTFFNLFIAKPYENPLVIWFLKLLRPIVSRLFYLDLVIHTKNFRGQTWLGRTNWQPPFDFWNIQEVLSDIKPELLIETGTHRGGSAYAYAKLFDDLDHDGRIVSVDIENKRESHAEHSKVTFLVGSSTDEAIIEQINSLVTQCSGPVMVILDSDHSQGHVQKELELYNGFVTPDSFLHVQDGFTDLWGKPGPLAAINYFLVKHPEFEIDNYRCTRYIVTHNPKGWLRKLPNLSSPKNSVHL